MTGTKSLIVALVFSASVAAAGTVAAQDGTNAIPPDAAKKAIEYCTKIAPSFSAHASCMRMQKETYDKMSPGYTNGTVAYDPGEEARKARMRPERGKRGAAAVGLLPPPLRRSVARVPRPRGGGGGAGGRGGGRTSAGRQEYGLAE